MLAGYLAVSAHQGESRLLVVQGRPIPEPRIVAKTALASVFSLVPIIFNMTLDTFLGCVVKIHPLACIFVAGLALCLAVLAF